MRTRLVLLIASLLMLVGCDHGTKLWAEQTLRAARPIEVVGGVLDLRYAANTDIAFSLLRGIQSDGKLIALVVLGTVAIMALIVVWFRRRHAPVMEQSAYMLLLAGALGNVLDRALRGYVVDFIHVHNWPIFNVADALIVAGCALLALTQLPKRRGVQATPS